MAGDDWWRRPLTDVFAGRRVILAGGVAAMWTPTVDEVRRFDATVGIDEEMARIRAMLGAVADPPPEVVAAVEAFDADGRAVVVGSFLGDAPILCGRRLLAHRGRAWVALEDKTTADALFDAAGVARAPSIVVPVAGARQRRHEIDAGAGTVWALDASEGFHGGGTGTRWVVDDADADRVTDELGGRGARVRVMPFLEGIATSIHGIVLPDGVAVVRPVELVTLRRGRELLYAGCTTFWDPPPAVRGEMRAAARRVGELLRDHVDFRGAFTVDGVATVEGWRPTELNPRNGAGLTTITRGIEGFPLQMLLDLVVAGRDIGIGAAALEEELVGAADEHRAGGTWILDAAPSVPVDQRPVAFGQDGWRWTDDADHADGTVVAGGTFARCTYVPASTPVGPSTGERAVALWRFLDEAGITAVGSLTAPPDVLATR